MRLLSLSYSSNRGTRSPCTLTGVPLKCSSFGENFPFPPKSLEEFMVKQNSSLQFVLSAGLAFQEVSNIKAKVLFVSTCEYSFRCAKIMFSNSS